MFTKRFNRTLPNANPSVIGVLKFAPTTMTGLYPDRDGFVNRFRMSSYGFVEVSFELIDDNRESWIFLARATADNPRHAHQIGNFLRHVRPRGHLLGGTRVRVRYFPTAVESVNGKSVYEIESISIEER